MEFPAGGRKGQAQENLTTEYKEKLTDVDKGRLTHDRGVGNAETVRLREVLALQGQKGQGHVWVIMVRLFLDFVRFFTRK